MREKMRIPLKEVVCREIRQQIVFGSLLPNEHLKEARLANHFGCTRGPVREALNQLEQQGFVTLVPNQGATVREPSAREVNDFYNLLAILEGRAVQWAVPLMTEKDIGRLRTLNHSLRSLLEAPDTAIEEWIPSNLEFHRLFREKCGNAKMNWLVDEIRTRITRYRYISLLVTAFGAYAEDHEEIVDRVARKDALKAGRAMEAHIYRAKDILVRHLSRMPARAIDAGGI